MANQKVLSAYRTLTLTEGVNIICNGNICVSAKLLSSNGGNKSAYPTDECGVINMANGGHIELNEGANLYCWGYIKGQDMDQGNNTQNVGSVTANAGSVIWENFELGDWRGGSASLDIYNNNVIDHRKLFPFQSYAIQNVEVPTAFMYGSVMRNYTSITTGMGNHGAVFSMIGPSETMFLLTDEQSMVRTWYDATSDLTCYELSGTAQLDALHITVYVSMSSEDFILPICNSMHINLKDCNMTLSNPLTIVFWGSVLTAKIADEGLKKGDLASFSCGAVSATVLFMTCVAALGTVLSTFLPDRAAAGLNLLVGLLIVFFGLRMLMRRSDS